MGCGQTPRQQAESFGWVEKFGSRVTRLNALFAAHFNYLEKKKNIKFIKLKPHQTLKAVAGRVDVSKKNRTEQLYLRELCKLPPLLTDFLMLPPIKRLPKVLATTTNSKAETYLMHLITIDDLFTPVTTLHPNLGLCITTLLLTAPQVANDSVW